MKTKGTLQNLALIYFFVDVLAIVAAYYTTLYIRFDVAWGEPLFAWINRTLGIRESGVVGDDFRLFYIISAPRIIGILVVTLCMLYALRDLYAERRLLRRPPLAWNILVANGIALAIFYTYFYLDRNVFHPRSLFATMLFINTLYGLCLRLLADRLLRALRERAGIDRCPAILVGRNRDADFLHGLIGRFHCQGISVAERLDWAPEVAIAELLERIREATVRHAAELIVVAERRISIEQSMQVLELADTLDVAVKLLSRDMDVLATRGRVSSDFVHGVPLLHFDPPAKAQRHHLPKQIVSILAAAVLLVGLAPLLLLIGLLIRLTSPGPALFVQERIGVNRRPFRMFKYRTMRERAAEEQAQVEEFNESGPGLFKMRDDPRVTWIGRLLRRYSLDELPQLLNIVRGEMTLVGPRPLPRRDFENYYERWHYGRHGGLPGLTCLWQVSGRSELDFHTMCILDVYYLRNQNWVMDLKIALRTVWVVLFATGAY